MTEMASQITSLTSVYSRRRSKKTSKLRVTGLCEGNSPWPVNSPHKGPVTRKKFPFDAVIITWVVQRWMKRCASTAMSLLWRHNGRDSVSNHQPHDCLLNRLFRRSSKKTSKIRVTGLCAGNSPGTGEFPAQKASNAENIFIWWRHHGIYVIISCCTIFRDFKLLLYFVRYHLWQINTVYNDWSIKSSSERFCSRIFPARFGPMFMKRSSIVFCWWYNHML